MRTTVTAGELLENDLGWAAWKLHLAVAGNGVGGGAAAGRQ
ncbi:hypothetical protein LINPERHAP1_LOCUS28421 [Linum perenne]